MEAVFHICRLENHTASAQMLVLCALEWRHALVQNSHASHPSIHDSCNQLA